MRSTFAIRTFLGLLLALALPFVSRAQQTGEDRFSLRGTVTNSVTGEAIGGALVQLIPEKTQFTSADGAFEFTGLIRGQFLLLARKPGFFNEQDLGLAPMNAATAVPVDGDVLLKLTPEGVIYGQVKDEDGQPIEGLTVRAQRWQAVEGERRLQPSGEATTDDQGNFRIPELFRGTYYLSFQQTRHGWRVYDQLRRTKQEQQGYGIQFYPGVPDVVSATAIEARPGTPVRISQALYHQRVFEVSGVVRGGDPEAGFGLTLMNDAGEITMSSEHIDPKSGEFQISGVPEGTYLLRANANHPAGDDTFEYNQSLNIELPVSVHGDVSGLMVVLGGGTSIGVQLHDETSSSSPGELHRVWIQMIPKGFSQFVSQTVVLPPIERRAARRFQGLSPGTYNVRANPEQPGYIASLRCGGTDLLREDLIIGAGVSLPPIEVTLRNDGAELTVSLTENGRPAGAAGVVVYSPDYPQRSLLMQLEPGASSTVQVAPGTYQLVVVRDPGDVEFRNPAAMEKYLAHAHSISLSPLGKATVNLEVPPENQP